ncbi:MAG: iron chelate uptake ABC transporter family permease subunit, partial [Burkholderiaceae bacterium]
IALAILLDLSPLVGVPLVTFGTCVVLLVAQRSRQFSSDTILAILAHVTLALGLVILALTGGRTINIEGLLFGDILTVGQTDLWVIYIGGAGILTILIWQWRRLLAVTLSTEIAEAEGLAPQRAEWLFMILIAMVVSIALKLVGVLLITALLIIPAAAARHFSGSPEAMAVIASCLGIGAVIAGLFASAHFDTPSGPSIIVAAGLLLLVMRLASQLFSNQATPPHTDGETR